MADYMSRQECQLAHQEFRRKTDGLQEDVAAYRLEAQTWMTKLSENTLAISQAFSGHLTDTKERIEKYDDIVNDYKAHKTTENTVREMSEKLSAAVDKKKAASLAQQAFYIAAAGTFFSVVWVLYQIYHGLLRKGVI